MTLFASAVQRPCTIRDNMALKAAAYTEALRPPAFRILILFSFGKVTARRTPARMHFPVYLCVVFEQLFSVNCCCRMMQIRIWEGRECSNC